MNKEEWLVVIGASAGGLKAIEEFFSTVPATSDHCFLILQHLAVDPPTSLPTIFKPHTKLPVVELTDGIQLEGGKIFVTPGGIIPIIDGDRIRLHARKAGEGIHPIDGIFKIAAISFEKRTVGVILSGTGSDGTVGSRAIREGGGWMLVQDPQSAEFPGMPQSVISDGIVDDVLRPSKMWTFLDQLRKGETPVRNQASINLPVNVDKEGVEEEIGAEDQLASIFECLSRRYGIDFRSYRLTSVRRRIEQRMKLLGIDGISAYTDHLKENSAEVDSLFYDLMIGVTSFFRDSDVFNKLSSEILQPSLRKCTDQDFRIWSVGCATGQEAYSLLMTVIEACEAVGYDGSITIFATDVSGKAIRKAGEGIFSGEDLAEMSEARRERFFLTLGKNNFKIKPEIRQRVIFAQHNVLSDPPFLRMDLISCRNVLIYFKEETQERVMKTFHSSLNESGTLFLGKGEHTGALEGAFQRRTGGEKFYRKIQADFSAIKNGIKSKNLTHSKAANPLEPGTDNTVRVGRELLAAYDLVLDKCTLAGFLLNSEREIIYYFGDASRYCKTVKGRLDSKLFSRLEGELETTASLLLHRAMEKRVEVNFSGVRFEGESGEECLDLHVESIGDTDLYLFTILPQPATRTEPVVGEVEDPIELKGKSAGDKMALLQDELRSVRERLQTANEELQVTNEELQATNEELQVTNEELQTTNEELLSTNEELRTVNDEYDRKNQELIRLNAEMENLLGSSEDGYLFIDKDFNIRKFNAAIASAFYLLPSDIGQSLYQVVYHLKERDRMLDEVRTALEKGERSEREVTLGHGSYLLRIVPITGGLDLKASADEVEGALISFTDIERTKILERQLDFAISSADMSWWDWNLGKDEIRIHSVGSCLLGMECFDSMRSRDGWLEQVHPDDREAVSLSLDRCLSGEEEQWSVRHRFRIVAGDWLWVSNAGLIRDRNENGDPVTMMGTTLNIDRVKRIEEELRVQRDILNAAGDVANMGAWEVNLETDTLFWSKVTRDIHEVGEDYEPSFDTAFDFYPEPDRSVLREGFDSGLAEEAVFENDLKFITAKGNHRIVRVKGSPRMNDAGKVERMIGVIQDVTELRHQEQELLDAKLKAEEANRAKSDFLAVMSHELRTPLNPILGFAQILMDDAKDDDTREILETITRAGNDLVEIIDEVLDFAKIEAGRTELVDETFSLHELITHKIRLMGSQLKDQEVQIESSIDVQVAEGEQLQLIGDVSKIKRILRNYLSNAIKFTEQGVIRLEVTVEPLKPGRVMMEFRVTDPGVGIEKKNFEKLFVPFSQIDISSTRKYGGTGLGLSICKELAELMGGDVSVESEIGRGSTFIFRAPFTIANPKEDVEKETEVAKSDRNDSDILKASDVLVVEDNPSNSVFLSWILKKLECRVRIAEEGEEALKCIEEARPDLILLDLHMPVMNGKEILKRIRASESENETLSRIPVAILTADASKGTKEECFEIGADEFLLKPVDAEKICEVLKQFLPALKTEK